MDTKAYSTIDQYLNTLPTDKRLALENIRQTVLHIVPQAQEVISYAMPAFKYNGILLYFAAFTNHCSLFIGPQIIAQHAQDLQNYKTSKGTIQFTPQKPIPQKLLKTMIQEAVTRNQNKKQKK